MDKGRSSRLKRKICPRSKSDESKISKIVSAASEKHIEKVTAIVLSSDSDEEFQKQVDIEKEKRACEKDNVSELQDPSIQKLRKLIYKLSSTECQGSTSCDPFPPHIQNKESPVKLNSPESLNLKDRLQEMSNDLSLEELRPFPKSCDKCRKLKICCKTAVREGAEFGCSQIVSSSSAILTSNNIENMASDMQTDRSVRANHSDIVTRNENVDANRIETRNSAEVNNSHLMKDRNSNFYCLQSRNQHHSLHGHHSQSGGGHSSSVKPGERFNTGPEKSNVTSSESTSCDTNNFKAGVIYVKQSNTSGMVNKDSSNVSEGTRDTNIDLIDKSRNKSKNLMTFQRPGSSKSYESGNNHKLVSQLLPTGHSSDNSGVNSLQSYTKSINSSSKSLEIDEMDFTAKRPKTGTVGVENKPSSRKDALLLACPMCQMKFDVGIAQIDVDRHLATCLSAADDDFNW